MVNALSVYNNELTVAGDFTTAGGVSANRIASWNGSQWRPLGTGINGIILALSSYQGELVVGGTLFSAGGNVSAYFARWGPDCPRGDLNCDQVVDLLDVPLFVDAVLNAPVISVCESYTANVNADVEMDGTARIDGQDVVAFVALLVD